MWNTLSTQEKQELIAYLSQFVTRERRQLIEQVLAMRTRYITVVLEDIFQPHNASAVIRSCECFGVQDVHVIEKMNRFRPNKGIVVGAAQWVTLRRYTQAEGSPDATRTCLLGLKERGYRLVATTLRDESIPIQELALDHKLALCFGKEWEGLSEEAHELADVFVKIPMVGFTQSFNVSVTVALTLYELMNRLWKTAVPWQLSQYEQTDLTIEWLLNSIDRGDLFVRRFLQEKGWGPQD